MKIHCPDSECQKKNPCVRIARKGRFFRRSDGQAIRRFKCAYCRRGFSSSTLTTRHRQKKRQWNHKLYKMFCSGISQRRAAKLTGLNRKTVVRKFRFLSKEAKREHEAWFQSQAERGGLSYIQFDDLETSEHSKCKPLSVALAVDPDTRKILTFEVSRMPPKGRLVHIAHKKYGPRRDERGKGWNKMFQNLTEIAGENATFHSDENPHYPRYLKRHLPNANHKRVKGGRGSIAGQGELKKLRFDPLFSLNHTCAMLRANMNRLFRKTWCTTKTIQGLIDHLNLYVRYHNEYLTREIFPEVSATKGAS